ncbi:MAG: glycosyltransferase family 4 protein [Erysipelotrichales bacterium]|nr:glycosyltransferase family 4 protein [Erysipelotrichales bacterium]
MKVLLYFEKEKALRQSGIGRALRHQKQALEANGVDYTLDPKDSFDIAHINTNFFESYRLLKRCKKEGKKVIVHGHSTFEDFRKSFRCWKLIEPFFDRLIIRMYRNADAIITPTQYSKHLIENYKGVTCPVYSLSNGINLPDYAYSGKKVKQFRNYFKLKPQEKVVIGVGLFFERKGILDFFEIARQMPDVKFIWFGHLSKIMTQGKILRAIKKRPSNVIMPGYIDGDIIKGAFSNANLVLFPTLEETEGIVVLEALASKTPVLVRDIPVFDGWLEDNVNCLKAKDNDEFIKKINYALYNDLSNIIENGYKTVTEREIALVGKELVNIYHEVLKN